MFTGDVFTPASGIPSASAAMSVLVSLLFVPETKDNDLNG